jgi:hypothetical protein
MRLVAIKSRTYSTVNFNIFPQIVQRNEKCHWTWHFILLMEIYRRFQKHGYRHCTFGLYCVTAVRSFAITPQILSHTHFPTTVFDRWVQATVQSCRVVQALAFFSCLYAYAAHEYTQFLPGNNVIEGRSHWPRGLKCSSAAARLLRLWVRT